MHRYNNYVNVHNSIKQVIMHEPSKEIYIYKVNKNNEIIIIIIIKSKFKMTSAYIF